VDKSKEGVTVDEEIGGFYSDMLRFAKLQLRDLTRAEDVVQEAITSALAGQKQFKGEASLKSWVFSILRNKIIDVLRHGNREIHFSDLVKEGQDLDLAIEDQFEQNGSWTGLSRPSGWESPEESLNQEQFWLVFKACLDHLPENTARIFMMREILDFDVEEICSSLEMKANNCYIILYRARMKLRGCLNQEWFDRKEGL
jgi:RNA polymerase sigma-70 factor, ECF subfamily